MSSDFATPPGLRHRQIAVRDTTLHVAEVGSGPPVLLLHGWPEFWATWLPLMNRLHGGFRLIAPDLRGFGDSAKAAAPRSDVGANSHADDMASLVVALGLDSVGVVGHDVGAYAAQAMARRHPPTGSLQKHKTKSGCRDLSHSRQSVSSWRRDILPRLHPTHD